MGLRNLFGREYRDTIWHQVAEAVGGEVVDRGMWNDEKVVAKAGPWTVTLDTYTMPKPPRRFTRLVAPYRNLDHFRFTVYRASIISSVGKLFGMQDIEIGDPEFDREFIVKGNSSVPVRALLANPRIRELLRELPEVYMTVLDDNGPLGSPFPADADMLYFYAHETWDVTQLKSLYELFAEVLNTLHEIGSADDADPGVSV